MEAKHRTQGPGFVAEEVTWRGHRVGLQVSTVGYPESMAEAVAQRKACHDTLDSALAALNAEPALRSQVKRLREALEAMAGWFVTSHVAATMTKMGEQAEWARIDRLSRSALAETKEV